MIVILCISLLFIFQIAETTNSFERIKALECSICLNRFRVPKALPCLHTFCKVCLLGIAPSGTKTVSCPLCRQEAIVPDEDAAKFPTNFHLTELIENEALREKLTGGLTTFTCTCCGNKLRVVGKCDTCNQYLCKDGREAHEVVAAWRNHTFTIFEMCAEEVNH